jgi:hypothetical protein
MPAACAAARRCLLTPIATRQSPWSWRPRKISLLDRLATEVCKIVAAHRFLSLLVFGCLLLATAGASAQVKQGSTRLWLDTTLVGFTKVTTKNDGATNHAKFVSIGPDSPGYEEVLPGYVGVGLGYVVSPHVIPGLHFSFNHFSSKREYSGDGGSDSSSGPKLNSLLFQPELELPFNPDSSSVLSGVVGFDLRHLSLKDGGDSEKVNGYGPMFGARTHFFVGDKASFDLSALMSLDFWHSKNNGNADNLDVSRSFSFGLLAGLSLWP